MEQHPELNYAKTGYLHSDFKLFYLADSNKKEFDFHYHDFYKVLIFLNGNVSYSVEGKYFDLQPDDVILVSAGEIHRPVIHSSAPYERIVVYLSRNFFEKYKEDDFDLFYCFQEAKAAGSSLIRVEETARPRFAALSKELSLSCRDRDFAGPLYRRIKFLEYLILLNRSLLTRDTACIRASEYNQTVLDIMNYVNEHITDDLDIDAIAEHFFLTRYYIMHLFKAETGITIGKYITEKRLFTARKLIQSGSSVTDACYQSGFRNYSAFYRAYKNKYRESPRNIR
ncbi:MAG: helix-turn-helix domain-containing protein [Lachnospiraceae bacterium]